VEVGADCWEANSQVKVSVAQVVNGQVAGTSDLASLLAGDQSGNFASLLDLGGTTPDLAQTPDGGTRKHSNQGKDKGDNDGQPISRKSRSSAASALGAQTVLGIAITPWQVESDSSWKMADLAKLTCSSSRIEPMCEPAEAIHLGSSAANEKTVRTPAMIVRQLPDESAPKPSLLQDLNGPSSIELPEDRVGSPAIEMKTPVTTPNGSGMPQIPASSSLIGSVAVQPSASSNTSIPSSNAHTESNPIVDGISMTAAGHAAPSHETKSADGHDNPPPTPGDQATGSSIENGGQRLSTPTQAEREAAPSSSATASGWNPNSVSETHRGAAGANETITDRGISALQKLRSDSSGAVGPNTALQGHPAVLNSDHSDSIREAPPNAQVKEPMSARWGDENAGRLLGSAMRGDLRVGVQTEAFGHVTIQANAQGGQLSAQLSLENAKESAVLAAHLPAAEHRLIQEHGVTASVRLAGGFGGTASGFTGREQSGSNRRDSGPYVSTRLGQMEHHSSTEGVEAASMVSRYFATSRLDVTV
jgi:hypothetical protein